MNRREEYNKIAERVVGHVENNTTDQANSILSIPTSDYTCKDRWGIEIKKIFKELPLMLALTIEIPNKGDYKSMEVVGIPVLITRDKDDNVHAFRNVCSHRGAPLTGDEIGNRNKFTCPYHGWTYSNKGDLIGILENEKFGELYLYFNSRNKDKLAEEVGDILFTIVNLTRHYDLDPEDIMRRSNLKFEQRFKAMEKYAEHNDLKLDGMNVAQLEEVWQKIK